MRILLDSHVFVWAKGAPEQLADEARAAIIDPGNDVFVSIATAWELWLKHAKEPIAAIAPVLDGGAASFLKATRESGFTLLAITLEHTAMAAALPRVHTDPFDRMLIAQAIVEDLTAITVDPIFRRYRGLRLLHA
jgi:PIN domain nuclease of toxin-antitoxin system